MPLTERMRNVIRKLAAYVILGINNDGYYVKLYVQHLRQKLNHTTASCNIVLYYTDFTSFTDCIWKLKEFYNSSYIT